MDKTARARMTASPDGNVLSVLILLTQNFGAVCSTVSHPEILGPLIPPLKSPPMSARISGFFVCNKALNRQEMLEQTHCHIRLYGIVENG